MPEIGEVARIVHYLKKHVVGKAVAAVKTTEDDIIYGKVGTSASAFQKAMTGKKVLDARQQGKYFWLVMDSPPHPVMHFGMSGWMKFSNEDTAYYKPTKEEEPVWPPKYWKFVLEMAGSEKCEAAFVDPRRLGRIRLVEAEGDQLRQTSPLKENGPDPVVDKDILTHEWLVKKMNSKKVPVKALLLDQANISGVGNWVADEVLYQAKFHPEQYSNTFSDDQIKKLHDSLVNVCSTAVDLLADSDQFPENWLMKHRWGKGKKDGNKLPNGEKIIFLKVGGRTSAVVPSVQKKTGAVAGDVSGSKSAKSEDEDADVKSEVEDVAEKKPAGRKTAAKPKSKAKENGISEEAAKSKPAKRGRAQPKEEEDEDVEEEKPVEKKSRKAVAPKPKKTAAKPEIREGQRRSARNR